MSPAPIPRDPRAPKVSAEEVTERDLVVMQMQVAAGATLDDLGLPGEQVGFVDDVPANVESARSVGIRAVLHDPASGAVGLVEDLTPLVPQLADLGARP